MPILSLGKNIKRILPLLIAVIITLWVILFVLIPQQNLRHRESSVGNENNIIQASDKPLPIYDAGYALADSAADFYKNYSIIYVVKNFTETSDRLVFRLSDGTEQTKDILKEKYSNFSYSLSPDGTRLLVQTDKGFLISKKPNFLNLKLYKYQTEGIPNNATWRSDSRSIIFTSATVDESNEYQYLCCTTTSYISYYPDTGVTKKIGTYESFTNPQGLFKQDYMHDIYYYQAYNLHIDEMVSVNAKSGVISDVDALSSKDLYSASIFSDDFRKAYTLDDDTEGPGGDVSATRVVEVNMSDGTKRTLFRLPEYTGMGLRDGTLELEDSGQNLLVTLEHTDNATYKINLDTLQTTVYQPIKWFREKRLPAGNYWLVTNAEYYGIYDPAKKIIYPVVKAEGSQYGNGPYTNVLGVVPKSEELE